MSYIVQAKNVETNAVKLLANGKLKSNNGTIFLDRAKAQKAADDFLRKLTQRSRGSGLFAGWMLEIKDLVCDERSE